MGDIFVLIGGAAGLICLLAYVWIVSRRGAKANLADGIALITAGVGFLTGIKVCWFAYAYRDVSPIKEISIQTFIGGVALCWVAVESAIKKFRGP